MCKECIYCVKEKLIYLENIRVIQKSFHKQIEH
jgi:hypothetical protein